MTHFDQDSPAALHIDHSSSSVDFARRTNHCELDPSKLDPPQGVDHHTGNDPPEYERFLRELSDHASTEDITADEFIDSFDSEEIWLERDLSLDDDSIEDLLPEVDGDDEIRRRSIKHKIKKLPGKLRRLFRTVTSLSVCETLLEQVDLQVQLRAKPEWFRSFRLPGALKHKAFLLEIYRRRILEELTRDRSAFKYFQDELGKTKKTQHLFNLFGNWQRIVPPLSACKMSNHGTWTVESWLGLGTSSMPEEAPEGVIVGLAQRFWRRFRKYKSYPGQERVVASVLHVGAMQSTFAIALWETAPKGLAVAISEVDTVGQAQSIDWVKYRGDKIPAHRTYDLAFVHVPPPGVDANQVRNRYKDLPGPLPHSASERVLHDIGRLGPRKWQWQLPKVIRESRSRLKPGGELVLLLPLAVRITAKTSRYPEWGYEPRPDLIEQVPSLLKDLGLHMIRSLDVIEDNPVNQPYFRKKRCPWCLIIASTELPRKTKNSVFVPSDGDDNDDADDFTELLADLDLEP